MIDEAVIATNEYDLIDPTAWLMAPAKVVVNETEKEVTRRQAATGQPGPIVEASVLECLFGGPGFCF